MSVRCGSEKEIIGSLRAGDRHALSAKEGGERRWQVRAVSCPLHTHNMQLRHTHSFLAHLFISFAHCRDDQSKSV